MVARRWFKLPYHFARMTMDGADDACTYRTERLWPGPPAGMTEVTSRFGTDVRYAEPGTLEFWLLERYLLYSQAGHRLFTGQVHHTPYPFTDAEVTLAGETLTTAAGLAGLGAPNVAAQYSPGVSVEVFPLRPCD